MSSRTPKFDALSTADKALVSEAAQRVLQTQSNVLNQVAIFYDQEQARMDTLTIPDSPQSEFYKRAQPVLGKSLDINEDRIGSALLLRKYARAIATGNLFNIASGSPDAPKTEEDLDRRLDYFEALQVYSLTTRFLKIALFWEHLKKICLPYEEQVLEKLSGKEMLPYLRKHPGESFLESASPKRAAVIKDMRDKAFDSIYTFPETKMHPNYFRTLDTKLLPKDLLEVQTAYQNLAEFFAIPWHHKKPLEIDPDSHVISQRHQLSGRAIKLTPL